MLFVILGLDAPDSLERRLAARPAHLARLHALAAEDRLLLAGPMPAPDSASSAILGSLIVAEFPSIDDARDWAQADPYRAAGVYAGVEVYPFRKVLP